ncbi:hypothetical protein C8R46DRAFT_1026579 [Mycena filopes]|nr:hypothetical protein C8R46DRAFT_1026579 [Mycena filopes]
MSSFQLQQEPRSTKLPLVDSGSSNRMKLHAHLRSASASSPHKSPPTCTLSLASVSTASGGSIHSTAVPFAAPSLYAFPGDDHSAADSRGDTPKHLRRPRARTSHVETPRRAQPVWRTPRERGSPGPVSTLSSHPSSKAPPPKTPDLRLAALVERSITQYMQEHPPAPESEAGLIHRQDALLVERIHVMLLRHKRHTRPSSPTGLALAPATCAPSVLMSAVGGGENLFAVFSAAPHADIAKDSAFKFPGALHPRRRSCPGPCALRVAREHRREQRQQHARYVRAGRDADAPPARGRAADESHCFCCDKGGAEEYAIAARGKR